MKFSIGILLTFVLSIAHATDLIVEHSLITVLDGYTFKVKNANIDYIVILKDVYTLPVPDKARCLKEQQRYYAAKRCVTDRIMVANRVDFRDPYFKPDYLGVIYSDVHIDGERLKDILIQRGLAFDKPTDICQ